MTKKPKYGVSRSVYIPPEVDKWLQERMEDSCRSMNAEIIFILKKEMKNRKA
jgi:hypothetical protein